MHTFSHKHVILPVIHVESLELALRNVEIAGEAGADGVFLIGHSMGSGDLLEITNEVLDKYPDLWVGVNCLGLLPVEVFEYISPKVQGVWADDAGIYEHSLEQSYASDTRTAQQELAPQTLYFGGVAFKYQRTVSDLELACQAAEGLMDVITTSGPGTGKAASIEKVRRMKGATEIPIGIASGITPENVREYLPYVDYYLVATGISKSFTELDPIKVKELVEAVRSG